MRYKPQIVSAYYVSEGLPEPQFEIQHIPDRLYKLDIGWAEHKIGVEVQGGIWLGKHGAHSTGKAIKRDMEKHNLGLLNGWLILKIEPEEVCMLDTVKMIKSLMLRPNFALGIFLK